MDLAYLSSLSICNNGHKYLLNVTDIFSLYAWGVPLNGKNGTAITAVSKYLFQNRKPITIQSGKGTEFVNETINALLEASRSKVF